MSTKKIAIAASAAACILLATFLGIRIYKRMHPAKPIVFDPLNATYTIDGKELRLVQGTADSETAPGSAEKTETAIIGRVITGDLDGDGNTDAGFILTQSTSGSGTFYYAVAAMNTAKGAVGTNAILLGDRIAPEAIAITNGYLRVDYKDRKLTDPMTAAPSVSETKYLAVNGTELYDIPVAAAYPLYPKLSWNDQMTVLRSSGTNPPQLVGIEISAKQIQNVMNISTVSAPFEKYYKDMLYAEGWDEDLSLAAGGPGSSIIAFKKGSEYLMTKYQSTFSAGAQNAPEECPCSVSFSLFAGVDK